MNARQYIIGNYIDSQPKNLYGFVPVQDVSHLETVRMLYDIYKDHPNKLGMSDDIHGIPMLNGESFSITGGFCRNLMLGTNHPTDVDVVVSSNRINDLFAQKFERVETPNVAVSTFNIPGNTMHVLENPHYEEVNGKMHVFIRPEVFDFTVNLGCISMTDGWLYAPPVTLFDIKNKILRPCTQPIQDWGTSSVLILSMMLRAIRFALKYDMVLHRSIVRAMNILFKIENDTKRVDDLTLYHSLKHMEEDGDEIRSRFYSILRHMNFIDTDKYDNFDDYYTYIRERVDNFKIRQGAVEVESPRSIRY